jgi:hypothetical protein
VRKFALLAVIAVVAALGITSTASAIQGDQGIQIKLKSSKAGTKKKPTNVKRLTVVTTTTPAAGFAGTFATNTAVIYFDKNLVFNPTKFKTCKYAKVLARKCAKGSKIGSGSAQAILFGVQVNLSVTPYNGPRGTISLLVRGQAGIAINSALRGKLQNAGGAYGKKLVVSIPSNLQAPAGTPPGNAAPYATLTSFTTKVGGTGKGGVPYVGLKGCSGGKVKIKGTFTFTPDNSTKTATNSTSCKK